MNEREYRLLALLERALLDERLPPAERVRALRGQAAGRTRPARRVEKWCDARHPRPH